MSAHNLDIEDFHVRPFPVVFFESTREMYRAVKPIITKAGVVLLIALAIPLSPIWVTWLYVLFLRSNRKIEKSREAMIAKWGDVPRSEEMFDTLEVLITLRSVFEVEGEFKMPKKFRMFRPFFIQTRRFYNLISDQVKWIENKVYPTAEELGIPPEDVEFMRSQMTPKDYEDLKDPGWFEFEKECIIRN